MPAPWKRIKPTAATNSLAANTPLPVTFDESSPLDASHSLAFVVCVSTSTAPNTPQGWELKAAAGGNGSGLWLGLYTRQADGSTNGVSITHGSALTQISGVLFAFEGGGTVLDGTPVVSNNASGTTATAGPNAATSAPNRILIAAVGLGSGGGGTWGSWDNGFTSIPSALSRLHVGVKAAPDAGTSQQSAVSWSSSRIGRDVMWVIEGREPATNTLPTVTIGGATDGFVGEEVVLTSSATDVDGTVAGYAWSIVGSDVTPPALSGANTQTVRFTPDRPMTVTVRASAEDNMGGVGFAERTIVVRMERPLATDRGRQRWSTQNRGALRRSEVYRGPDTRLGLVAEWNFGEASGPFATTDGAFPLTRVGTVPRVASPWGWAADLTGSPNYLSIAQDYGGAMNIGRWPGEGGVTVAAWVRRDDTDTGFIAGGWQEDSANPRRQYGLFIDLGMYGGEQQSCFHVSKTGGATPGYPYSRDYSASGAQVSNGVWQFHVGTYDGAFIRSYLNGAFTPVSSYTDNQGQTYAKNPYAFADGLNATPVEFTVGAVRLSSGMGNWFDGQVAKLRVWNRALAASEVANLYASESTVL